MGLTLSRAPGFLPAPLPRGLGAGFFCGFPTVRISPLPTLLGSLPWRRQEEDPGGIFLTGSRKIAPAFPTAAGGSRNQLRGKFLTRFDLLGGEINPKKIPLGWEKCPGHARDPLWDHIQAQGDFFPQGSLMDRGWDSQNPGAGSVSPFPAGNPGNCWENSHKD